MGYSQLPCGHSSACKATVIVLPMEMQPQEQKPVNKVAELLSP